MTRVVVFDMDDTLFPEHEFVYSGFRAVSCYMKKQFGVRDFYDEAVEIFLEGGRGDIFNRILTNKGLDDDGRTIGKLVDIYRSHCPEISLFEDAGWALKYYASIVPLALISDGFFETQRNKAKSLSLDQYFKKMYFTDQWGRDCWKPSTCAFEMVENEFSVSGCECVYISDNLIKDFIGPNKMGWNSIYINREKGEYSRATVPQDGKPKISIRSLFELKNILNVER